MKVLLIDDHPLILSALQTIIHGLGAHVNVICAESAKVARELLVAQSDFDLVLLDLQLGDANGFDVLVEFREAYPALPVVVVSASDRSSDVIRSIDLGAMGFVPKRASNASLFEALNLVMSGGIYVPPMAMGFERADPPNAAPDQRNDQRRTMGHALGHDMGHEMGHEMGQRAAHVGPQAPLDLTSLGLTPRQNEVLGQLLQAKPNKLIARDLNLSVDTVKDHVAAVLRALKVSSRTQAVLAVSQMSHASGGLPLWGKQG